jgi:hypothetical protein
MDKFNDITDEALAALRQEKLSALQPLLVENATAEQQAQALALDAELSEIDAEKAERAEAAAKFAALRSKDFSEAPAEVEAAEAVAEEADEEPESDEEPEASADDEPEAEAETAEVAATTETKASNVKKVAAQTKRPAVPETPQRHLTVIAAADAGFPAGSEMDLEDLAQGVVNRLKGMPEPDGNGEGYDLRKFGVATIEKPFDPEFIVDRGTDSDEVFERASQESRLPGGSLVESLRLRSDDPNSLVAANGWCAPSETVYDLTTDETLEGILSLPEVQIRRGGIRYTMGPQFADFYTNAGFVQTEAQAIAGTTKPCYEVTCPTFTDVRLDAVGVCIKVPILLNAGYPEMTQRFVSGTLVAHEHMKNANVIGRIVTASGAARVFAGNGGSSADALEALEMAADQRRQTYRLGLSHTLEVVVPFWVKGMYRSDLGRRNGRPPEAVSDAEIQAHFAARNLAVNFVYDWQVLDPTVEVYPTTYQVLLYPAGTFVKGVSNVINLSAVYDAASLAGNMYTGLFVEEGLLVAQKKFGSDLLTLPTCNAGRTGAANLTCA